MASDQVPLLRSPYLGRLILQNQRTLVCHVLGRVRLLCNEQSLAYLDAFAEPRSERQFFEELGALGDFDPLQAGGILDDFRDADFLQAADCHEETRIQALFTSVSDEVSGATKELCVAPRHPELADALSADSVLVLSRALAALKVGRGQYMVTHPLARRLHLGADLWSLAGRFRRPRSLAQVAEMSQLAMPLVLQACRFLLRKKILWQDRQAELQAGQECAQIHSGSPHPQVRFDSGCEQWEQRFRAYKLRDFAPVHYQTTVACIGMCQVHATTPALQYLGWRRGWDIEVQSWAGVTISKIVGPPPAAIFLSLAPRFVDLYEAIALQRWARCYELLPDLAAQFEQDLWAIRQQCDSPVLVHGGGHPGLTGLLASSPASHRLNTLLAHVNAELLARTQSFPGIYLLDQNRAVAEHVQGLHWDDEHNALRHHSCISAWGRLPRALGWTRGKLDLKRALGGQSFFPPGAPQQGDPVAPFALAYLNFIERLNVKNPVRLIVFEPNDLLWPGKLENRSRLFPKDVNFYTGDQLSKCLGIHEALQFLASRGVLLVCLSSCPLDKLEERWKIESDLPTLLHAHQVRIFEGGQLALALETLGVAPANTLLLNLPPATIPESFAGRTVPGAPWELRRYLLSSPEFHAVHAVPDSKSSAERRLRAVSPVRELESATVRQVVTAELREKLGCSAAVIESTSDLRALGLGSLGSMEVVSALEAALGLQLPDAFRTTDIVFSFQGLCSSFEQVARRSQLAETALEHESSLLGELSSLDIPTLLLQNFSHPRHPWIFKFLRSGAPMDYQFVSWPQLGEHSAGYLSLYRQHGLVAGDLVTLVMPSGLSLVAAVVGAFLGRLLPAISAYPSEKLSLSAFAGWFGELVSDSKTRLVLTAPHLREPVVKVLTTNGLNVGVCCDTPAPRDWRGIEIGPPRPDAAALVQYSSGTTGAKKAVLLKHSAVLANVAELARTLDCRNDDVIASWLPLYHDMGYVACLLLPLLRQIPTVMISPFDWVKRPQLLLEQISEQRATLCWLPNFAFLHCANRVAHSHLRGLNLSSLRSVINCSEPVTWEAMQRFYLKFSPYGLRRSALASSYAMAEMTFAVTQSGPGREAKTLHISRAALARQRKIVLALPEAPVDSMLEIVSSGRPLAGMRVEIIDKMGALAAEGEVGEIRLQGSSLMQAYYQDEAATAAAIREGWYYTGDLGAQVDGELYVTGRQKDLLIIAGQNIYPAEIEQSLTELSGIKSGRVVAVGIFEADLGTERMVVMAETTVVDSLALERLRTDVRSLITERFSIEVSEVVFVPDQTLLKSTSGKLSRSRNREWYFSTVQ